MQIKLFDKNSIDLIHWPKTLEAQHAKDLILPMIKEGVEKFISNVRTELYLLQVNEKIIPFTVNNQEYENSYLTSNYFPIKYAEESAVAKEGYLRPLKVFFIKGAGLFLKGLKINKTVIFNNWLLTTNIYPELSNIELEKVTHFLSQFFPDHVIIFRSLNEKQHDTMASSLKNLSYRLLISRSVFFYDPAKKKQFSSKVLYHHRRDRRLIETEGFEVFQKTQYEKHEIQRFLELYTQIYINKYTKYSPEFTDRYLTTAIEKGFLKIMGLKKEGKIFGVMGYNIRNNTMIIPFFGYESEENGSNRLYRMMTALALGEAEKANVLLNDGSGGAAPKQFRGMSPFKEYLALYDNHLPYHRRLFWGFAEKIAKKMAKGLLSEQTNITKDT